ncbi:hypothetical protein [Promicromonospora sp. NPDC050880]|uniref:hypothetical protein n=1 Tax=Promicromonospora sp. NPDC050880 TaxID=3364406 RepID=UPI00378E65DC
MPATPTRRATPPVRARTTGPRAAHPRAARRSTRHAMVTAWALAGALLAGCATTSPGADPANTPVDGPGTQQATPRCDTMPDTMPGPPTATTDAAPSTDAQDKTSDSAGTPCEPASATDATTPTPEQHLLLATQADGDSIALVDPRDRDGSAVVDEITVGAAPWDVAVHPGSGRAFVSTAEGVAVVDLATHERTHLLAYRHRPDRVAGASTVRAGSAWRSPPTARPCTSPSAPGTRRSWRRSTWTAARSSARRRWDDGRSTC